MKEVRLSGNWAKITSDKQVDFYKIISELSNILPEETQLVITEFEIEFDRRYEESDNR